MVLDIDLTLVSRCQRADSLTLIYVARIHVSSTQSVLLVMPVNADIPAYHFGCAAYHYINALA